MKQAAIAVQEQDIINQQKQGPQKADIDKRRQEELSILDAKQAASERTGEIPTDENGNAINIKEEKQKINSKYDAELAALEGKPTSQVSIEGPIEEKVQRRISLNE